MANDSDSQEITTEVLTYGYQFFSCICCMLSILMAMYMVYKAPVPSPQIIGGGLVGSMVICLVCCVCMAYGAPMAGEMTEDKIIQ